MTPIRLGPDSPQLPATLSLLRDSFAFMAARIDPPSSLTRMDLAALAREAAEKELWILPAPDAPDTEAPHADAPLACVILTTQPDALYIGKLAVAQTARGQGLSRQLLTLADTRARAHALPKLRVQTRVELTENQATFTALGFVETARTCHAGYPRPTSITYERPLNT
ncbi:N-acetyltransferase [Pseudooceanicola sp. HF7]|uniref:GNAT family N-acetyltransferase n=1 Tax=Pseudooceanicola sp. HF7 TaxID=2721560 RepID=UPI0014316229|nr:GNAT family N-acetyltransferase [Pseudooceanicola sp. HF7]NIZ10724.1 GNAT family N-acetyltransferase [Pseudooceanicola sp. HF7]